MRKKVFLNILFYNSWCKFTKIINLLIFSAPKNQKLDCKVAVYKQLFTKRMTLRLRKQRTFRWFTFRVLILLLQEISE